MCILSLSKGIGNKLYMLCKNYQISDELSQRANIVHLKKQNQIL